MNKQIRPYTSTRYIGNVYGGVKVIRFLRREVRKSSKTYRYFFICRCHCGKLYEARIDHLQKAKTRSCGCLGRKHNMYGTDIYIIWSSMKGRCNNVGNTSYINYGARGITYCDEWEEFLNFYSWAKKSGYRKGLSIERKDVNGNYNPENCEWIKPEEQLQNQSQTVWVKGVDNELRCLAEHCRVFDLNYEAEHTRKSRHNKVRMGELISNN